MTESGTQAPQVSLPKGGGAIRGIGEKFGANPVTGTGAVSVPIATSAGRSGFGPQLSLSYDSGQGNGPFGLGWNLALASITRKTDKGLPRYADAEESDVFILSGAEDLAPVLNETGGPRVRHVEHRTLNGVVYTVHRYRPRIEGMFARIERWTDTSDPRHVFWRATSRDNITTWYGRSAESRIADPADPGRIFSWLMCESYDGKGNAILYRYKPECWRSRFITARCGMAAAKTPRWWRSVQADNVQNVLRPGCASNVYPTSPGVLSNCRATVTVSQRKSGILRYDSSGSRDAIIR